MTLLLLVALATAPLDSAPPNAFADPPPNLRFQLEKQNDGHPWLRVTTDANRFDVRVERLDATGLSGLRVRKATPLPADPIAWRSIARIDEVVTRAHQGRITGLIVGAGLGAMIGNALGEHHRTQRTVHDPYLGSDYVISEGHGGTGAMFGALLIGGLGLWGGGRLGERMAKERPWYIGVPQAGASTPVAAGSTEPPVRDTLAPSTAQRVSDSPRVHHAIRRIDSDDLIRMRGDFGLFQGYAAVVGPAGLEGLRADPKARGRAAASTPTGLVAWDRIDSVDKRGSSAGRGAVLGATSLGLAGGLMTMAIVAGLGGDDRDVLGAAALGGLTCGAAGALLGTLIGAAIPAWHHVYDGP